MGRSAARTYLFLLVLWVLTILPFTFLKVTVERREKSTVEEWLEAFRNDSIASGTRRGWRVVSIDDFGAIADNQTDNAKAIQAAVDAVRATGGEVVVPFGGVYQTSPVNLTSNLIFRVEGTLFGLQDQYAYPAVPALPSYGRCADMAGKFRRHPLIHAMDAYNLTIRGKGTIDGGGWYWYPFFHNFSAAHNIGRPHLMELRNVTGLEITEVTLKDSAFWTLHPVYCRDVYIHHMTIRAPSCRNYGCANTDGIDIDSSENVLVEYNTIDVGDDHVTVLAGKLRHNRSPPTRNVTVQHNTLLSGMGLSIGSSTAGGISDVLYYNNVMTQQKRIQMGQGVHIKLRDRYGGYVRNVAWIDNVFYVAGKPGGAIVFEHGYQTRKQHSCNSTTCTEVRDIVIRNLTIHEGNPGILSCYPQRPCQNITIEDVKFVKNQKAQICVQNVASGTIRNVYPSTLFDACPHNMTTLK